MSLIQSIQTQLKKLTRTVNYVRSSAPSYKSYTALLTQTGTNAPTAIVLENTLGGTIVWTRDSDGYYIGTLANTFTIDKTTAYAGNGKGDPGRIYTVNTNYDENYIEITTSLPATPTSGTDGLLNRTCVQINVYI